MVLLVKSDESVLDNTLISWVTTDYLVYLLCQGIYEGVLCKNFIFTSISGIYMGVFFLYHRPDSLGPGVNVLCKLNGLLWSLTAFTTPTLLCLASAIRFMAIYMPYSYKDWVNIKNAIIGIFATQKIFSII